MTDKLQEECGVFGIYDRSPDANVAASAYFALYALQHRGQQSSGIAVNSDGLITAYKDTGLVPEVFNRERLESLGMGEMAVGHVRAATADNIGRANAQPLLVRHIKGPMAISYNGSLINNVELREELELQGSIFHTTTDVEVISYLITKERLTSGSIEKAISAAMNKLKGAYSVVMMSATKLIAFRDPCGFRPLCIGRKGDAIIFASETCALDSLGAEWVRDVEPGEIVVVNKEGMYSVKDHCGQKTGLCVFEYVYFARPDSVIEGVSVHEARLRAGAFLALEHPAQADVVIGVPDSGLDAALGFARQSGIPYGVGFIKNRYVGRSFIEPTQGQRDNAVRIKLNALSATVKGKRVVLVDDSIVRGTTSARIVKLIRDAGATEVHFRVSSPPFINPCYFGTDIDSKDKLIACKMSVDEIAKKIDADSLGYLSIYAVKNIAKGAGCDFCCGCFTGEYPIPVPECPKKDKYAHKISSRDCKTLEESDQ